MKYLLSILAVCFLFSCQKKNFDVDLPESVEFGESEIYLNGELREDYIKGEFEAVDVGELFRFRLSFDSSLNGGKSFSLASLLFGEIPFLEGTYDLHKEVDLNDDFATPVFGFSIGQHSANEKYDAISLDKGFIEITNLDMINKVVEGRFKANFKRTKKQILFPTGYPKFLEFQGVFHDSLTIN